MEIDKNLREFIEFPIRMQGEERVLRYSPIHLFHLKTALEHFEKATDEKFNYEDESVKENPEYTPDTTVIKRIIYGDKCPDCGTSNTHALRTSVVDIHGMSRTIDILICQCGTRYLTRRLFEKLDDPNLFDIKDVESIKTTQNNTGKKQKLKARPPVAVTTKQNKRMYIVTSYENSRKESPTVEKCSNCGKSGTVFNSGLCWECYKEERQGIYSE